MPAITVTTKGGVALLIDNEDLPIFRSRNWYIQRHLTASGRQYLYVASKFERALLHRLIAGASAGQVVDHIDGDGLNNTRANLRVCTHAQNMRNRRPNLGKVLPKGVSEKKGSFTAAIKAGGVRRQKRGFATCEAAAQCYAAWAEELHGAFARTK